MKIRFLLLVFVFLVVGSGIAMACDMMEGHDEKINESEHESCDMMEDGADRGMTYGMMGMMPMMNSGIMTSNWIFPYSFGYQSNIFGVLYLILLIGLIILVYLWIIRLWRELK